MCARIFRAPCYTSIVNTARNHLAELVMRGVLRVTPTGLTPISNVGSGISSSGGGVGNVLAVGLNELTSALSRKAYHNWMRCMVQIDGEVWEMVFLANSLC